MNALHLIKDLNVKSIDHMTHIDNLDSIIKNGLLPHNNPYKQIGINGPDICKRKIKVEPIHNRDIEQYVPLYFNSRNEMLLRNQRLYGDDIVVLAFEPGILLEEDVVFTNGDSCSSDTMYSNEMGDLVQMDWRKIWSRNWFNKYDERAIKFSMMAEVLIYKKVEMEKLMTIYCSSNRIKAQIESSCSLGETEVIVLDRMFFQRPQIKTVESCRVEEKQAFAELA
ncbi:MAG: DUF4433 domain-containing protein [Pseudomonadales bacterium]|nr:DUF4433 domain-containing protein [Pseudomonadales bacterium]